MTAGGRTLAAQAVICGVGAIPDVMLARKAGLTLGELGGVLCDSRLRTSAEGIYAAGDMCEYDAPSTAASCASSTRRSPPRRARPPRATCSARTPPHDEVPYFFSDLADWASLEYVGPAPAGTTRRSRARSTTARFAIWYREGGRVRAMLSVGGRGDLDRARELIRAERGPRAAGDLGRLDPGAAVVTAGDRVAHE